MSGRIILLNGVGSAGKSSIARELQGIAEAVFLHVQMDAFLDMLPAGREGGFSFETTTQDGHPSVVIHSDETGQRLMRGMRQAVVAMAQAGNNLILDEVLTGSERQEYATVLAPFDVFRVGVRCPLDVLEAREKARGDRLIGLARWQFDRVHRDMVYDLEVDTSLASALECAWAIKRAAGI